MTVHGTLAKSQVGGVQEAEAGLEEEEEGALSGQMPWVSPKRSGPLAMGARRSVFVQASRVAPSHSTEGPQPQRGS
jgi:hypothetical protein